MTYRHAPNGMGLGRRAALKAAAGLVVGIGLPSFGYAQTSPGAGELGAFIRIAPDGSVTVVTPCFELGQGSQTGLAMIVADELGADWTQVRVQTPPLDPAYRTAVGFVAILAVLSFRPRGLLGERAY